jgi:hypothetical protein
MHASDSYFCALLMFKHSMIGAFFSVGLGLDWTCRCCWSVGIELLWI